MSAATLAPPAPSAYAPVVNEQNHLNLRDVVCQAPDSSRNLLGLIALSSMAQRDINSGCPESTLDGVVSKSVLRSLLGALHYRDVATLRHSRRVALLAVGLASHLGWEGRHLRVLEVASLLHDIGKICSPESVLYKPSTLNVEEFELMDRNHGIGLTVLQACRVDADVLRFIDQAHRAYNAPESNERSRRDVHIGARILAVADAYESLCTDKVYRIAKPHADIMKLLMDESGKKFDGNIVNSLARWVQQDGIPFAAQTAETNQHHSRKLPMSLEEVAEAMAVGQIFSHLHMLESLYDGLHVVDAERRFVVWNRGIERLVGRSAADMLGTEWSSDLFTVQPTDGGPAARTRKVPSLDYAIDCCGPVISQSPFKQSDDSVIHLEQQTIPLIDANGHLHGFAEIFCNLTRKSYVPELKQLQLQVSRDSLTAVASRAELENQLKALIEQFEQNSKEPFSVIFVDADHFKRVNDTYGHQVGDQVLIDLAKHLCEETYSGEIVGRYGGEEFVILCPATELEQAVRRANRLRSSLAATTVGGQNQLKITCSFGVAEFEPTDTAESVLKRADKALYAAKEAGRDRTCWLSNKVRSSDKPEDIPQSESKPFEFRGSLIAVVGADMVIHKLAGFIKENNAQLVEVNRERVLLRLSGAGLLSFLGSSINRQGVEIELNLEGIERSSGHRRICINVKMTRHGWFRDARCFKKRTAVLMQELKRFFVAE